MYLEQIDSPADLKKLPPDALCALAKEIRELIIDTVSENGGHLGRLRGRPGRLCRRGGALPGSSQPAAKRLGGRSAGPLAHSSASSNEAGTGNRLASQSVSQADGSSASPTWTSFTHKTAARVRAVGSAITARVSGRPTS